MLQTKTEEGFSAWLTFHAIFVVVVVFAWKNIWSLDACADKPTSKNKKKRDARKAKATADVSMLLKNQQTWGFVHTQKNQSLKNIWDHPNCFLTEMYWNS